MKALIWKGSVLQNPFVLSYRKVWMLFHMAESLSKIHSSGFEQFTSQVDYDNMKKMCTERITIWMNTKKICPSCSAEYDDTLPKCPYCGTLNYKGAEAEYLEKLEDMRSDMEELGNIPKQETKKQFIRQGKFLKRILLGLGLLVLLFTVFMVFVNREQKIDEKAEYMWKQEHFPIWEELYENQDYEQLLENYWEAVENGKPCWDWKHADFCETLDKLVYLEKILDGEASGLEMKESYYVDLLYYELKIAGTDLEELSDDEKMRLAAPLKRLLADFETRWNFSEEEKTEIEKEQKENYGHVSFEFCEDYIEEWIRRSVD